MNLSFLSHPGLSLIVIAAVVSGSVASSSVVVIDPAIRGGRGGGGDGGPPAPTTLSRTTTSSVVTDEVSTVFKQNEVDKTSSHHISNASRRTDKVDCSYDSQRRERILSTESGGVIPIKIGPEEYGQPISDNSLLKGFKINIDKGENPFKNKVFEGEIKTAKLGTDYSYENYINSQSDLREYMGIGGSLTVNYKEIVKGTASAEYKGDKVRSNHQVAFVYRKRFNAYMREVDVSTMKLTADAQSLSPSELYDTYGTKFVEAVYYGAQLDVKYTFTSEDKDTLLKIGADLSGKIQAGPLKVGFEACFRLLNDKASSKISVEVESSAIGFPFPKLVGSSIEDVFEHVNDFQKKYDDHWNDAVEDTKLSGNDNALKDYFSPVAFIVGNVAEYDLKLNLMETVILEERMKELGDVFFESLYLKSKLEVVLDEQERKYRDAKDRATLFLPYKDAVNGEISKIENTIDKCLRYRRLSFTTIVGRDGEDAAKVPDYYPTEGKDILVIDGFFGNAYIPSPVSVATTEFDDIYYVGFTLPSTDRSSLLPWMEGNLRYDGDDSLVATAMTPRTLEREGFKKVHDIKSIGFDYVRYVDPPVFIESSSIWLIKSEGGKAVASHFFPIDSGLWNIRSNKDVDDDKDKRCPQYGDAIFLQHNETKEFLGIDYYYTVSSIEEIVGSNTPNTSFNFALGMPTGQSSTHEDNQFGSDIAVDGNLELYSHTKSETNPSWHVNLNQAINIKEVKVYNLNLNVAATWPNDFKFSVGIPEGYDCINITPDENTNIVLLEHTLVFFCWKKSVRNPGLKWSYDGQDNDMECTQVTIVPKSYGAEYYWGGYLCVPKSSELKLSWSNDGAIAGKDCISWYDCLGFLHYFTLETFGYLCSDSSAVAAVAGFKLNIYKYEKIVWEWSHTDDTISRLETSIDVPNINGDKVEIMIPGDNKILTLAEVEVYGELKATKPSRFIVKSHDDKDNDGLCVQMLSHTYLEYKGDYSESEQKILVGGLGRAKTEVQVHAESDIGDGVHPQWVFRKDDERIDGFSCGAVSAHGKWVSLLETNTKPKMVNYEVGISGRDHPNFWRNTESWEQSVLASVTGGFTINKEETFPKDRYFYGSMLAKTVKEAVKRRSDWDLIWPDDFSWSHNGPIDEMECKPIEEGCEPGKDEGDEYTGWKNNYMCWNKIRDPEFKLHWEMWDSGLTDMKCTRINEPADDHCWTDNRLCVADNSPLELHFSHNGTIDDMACILLNEPSDHKGGWHDNYICARPTFVETKSTRKLSIGEKVWQFVFDIEDTCDDEWQLKTDKLAVTPNSEEQPCCLPGFESDPNVPHGPCKLSSPCFCEKEICNSDPRYDAPKLAFVGDFDDDEYNEDEYNNEDGGTVDGGTVDGGTVDGGTVDGGTVDGGTKDGGTKDGGTKDGGTKDDTSSGVNFKIIPGSIWVLQGFLLLFISTLMF